MPEESFETFVGRERDRLDAQREAIRVQQRELEKQLKDLDRQYAAVAAYEAARTGKSAKSTGNRGRKARRGSRRDELLQVIKSGRGLSRGEVLEKMGLKGDKAGEMSVSNALTALVKANQIRRNDAKKYVSA